MSDSEIILYTAPDGARLQLRATDGTVWLTQGEIATLYGTSRQNVQQTIARVLADGEIDKATVNSELMVRSEGARHVRREVQVYNLDMVLAVGYRSSSLRAVQFRQWATSVLREYLVKGFAMDDERLKGRDVDDYFDELLERVRDIRASEKRFYQKVKDLYATAIDYKSDSDEAQLFFKKVQNKMLWAVTGHTAAEIISGRSDPDAANMGLTTWHGERVRKGDVDTAKNYLSEDEVGELNRIVAMYLDFAEDQAKRHQAMTMSDWSTKLDAFLEFNGRDLLTHAGKVRASVAKQLAEQRYDEFAAQRRQAEAAEADRQDRAVIEAIERQVGERKTEE
ncbi:MAG: virulence RhuM family protein [Actinomyces sp.]|nr:virulence RhuM family protein [Actinomyces sp.]MCI1641322.1 virulence RhuM family protein [Actinomyces sp.]MCI1662141.1 virulence RhuM family protein [Actinomyces sp.]MCI1690876.1 virulence RhuM family protein [Actinomyces sp.]MCI1788906.1 virulence RhuM family protein [Actinomyces sp.]